MTFVPKIVGSNPRHSRTTAAKALLVANPTATVLFDELLNDGEGRAQSRISSALIGLRARNPQLQVWTRAESDGYVRGYLALKPSSRVSENAADSEPSEQPAAPEKRKARKINGPAGSKFTRARATIARAQAQPETWKTASGYPLTQGNVDADEARRRLKVVQSRLLVVAKTDGVALQTRIRVCEKSARLDIRVVG